MRRILKKYISIILALCLVLGGRLQIADAATNHLIIINSKKNTMGYYVNNVLVKNFKVSTGTSKTPTPQGKTKIVNKIKNRPYYTGGIPGGSPNNPLGDRWLGLNLNGTYGTTYAIHGNNNENSIGKNITGGCVRMYNKEVRWLFDQVPVGTDVIIKNTDQSNIQIAASYGITVSDSQAPPIKTGWQTIDGKKYYFDSKGQKVAGWQTIDNNKYFFNKDGYLVSGPVVIDGKTYFFNSNGQLTSGWNSYNNYKYYITSDGLITVGWQTIEGKTYYFNTDGTMMQRWEEINGNMYYFGLDGIMRTGWMTHNNKTYYFDQNGIMKKGLTQIGDKWYYFYDDGNMARDVVVDDGIVINKDGVVVQMGIE